MIEWRKSSRSGSTDTGQACVEVAALPGRRVGLQDSKNPGPHLSISPKAFDDLVRRIKA